MDYLEYLCIKKLKMAFVDVGAKCCTFNRLKVLSLGFTESNGSVDVIRCRSFSSLSIELFCLY